MTTAYSGKIFWANNTPIQGAEVRLFEPFKQGKPGPELTLHLGISAADGSFGLSLRESDFLDLDLLSELDPLSARFERVNAPGSHASDPNRPALQVTYKVNGKVVHTYLPFRKLHRGYCLPYNPPVDFIPSRDGFGFVNSFKPFDPPVSFPDWLGLRRIEGVYGLCGGMSSGAYDFRLARQANLKAPNIRKYLAIPKTGTSLHRYLVRRALDTFGAAGNMLAKVGEWTLLPDLGPAGVQKLTMDELPGILQKLDYGQCVVTTLIYVSAPDLKALPAQLANNHQVLAYGYRQPAPDTYEIQIYDSNFPNRDGIVLQAKRVQVGVQSGQPVFGITTREIVPGEMDKNVRGIFEMNYHPALPPKN